MYLLARMSGKDYLRCPPFCYVDCNIRHHPLIVALINLDPKATTNESFSVIDDLINKYEESGDWTITSDIPDPNVEYRFPLLDWAAVLGQIAVIRWLTSTNLNVLSKIRQSDSGQENILHRAINFLHENTHFNSHELSPIIKDLIDIFKSKMFLKNKDENTPFHVCCLAIQDQIPRSKQTYYVEWISSMMTETKRSFSKDPSKFEILISSQNNQGDTPLHTLAKLNENSSLIKMLLDSYSSLSKQTGAKSINLDIKNIEKLTVMDIATRNGNFKICTMLAKYAKAEGEKKEIEPVCQSTRYSKMQSAFIKQMINKNSPSKVTTGTSGQESESLNYTDQNDVISSPEKTTEDSGNTSQSSSVEKIVHHSASKNKKDSNHTPQEKGAKNLQNEKGNKSLSHKKCTKTTPQNKKHNRTQTFSKRNLEEENSNSDDSNFENVIHEIEKSVDKSNIIQGSEASEQPTECKSKQKKFSFGDSLRLYETEKGKSVSDFEEKLKVEFQGLTKTASETKKTKDKNSILVVKTVQHFTKKETSPPKQETLNNNANIDHQNKEPASLKNVDLPNDHYWYSNPKVHVVKYSDVLKDRVQEKSSNASENGLKQSSHSKDDTSPGNRVVWKDWSKLNKKSRIYYSIEDTELQNSLSKNSSQDRQEDPSQGSSTSPKSRLFEDVTAQDNITFPKSRLCEDVTAQDRITSPKSRLCEEKAQQDNRTSQTDQDTGIASKSRLYYGIDEYDTEVIPINPSMSKMVRSKGTNKIPRLSLAKGEQKEIAASIGVSTSDPKYNLIPTNITVSGQGAKMRKVASFPASGAMPTGSISVLAKASVLAYLKKIGLKNPVIDLTSDSSDEKRCSSQNLCSKDNANKSVICVIPAAEAKQILSPLASSSLHQKESEGAPLDGEIFIESDKAQQIVDEIEKQVSMTEQDQTCLPVASNDILSPVKHSDDMNTTSSSDSVEQGSEQKHDVSSPSLSSSSSKKHRKRRKSRESSNSNDPENLVPIKCIKIEPCSENTEENQHDQRTVLPTSSDKSQCSSENTSAKNDDKPETMDTSTSPVNLQSISTEILSSQDSSSDVTSPHEMLSSPPICAQSMASALKSTSEMMSSSSQFSSTGHEGNDYGRGIMSYLSVCSDTTKQEFLETLMKDKTKYANERDEVEKQYQDACTKCEKRAEEIRGKNNSLKHYLKKVMEIQKDLYKLSQETNSLTEQKNRLANRKQNLDKKLESCENAVADFKSMLL